jgi:hypothetical protein
MPLVLWGGMMAAIWRGTGYCGCTSDRRQPPYLTRFLSTHLLRPRMPNSGDQALIKYARILCPTNEHKKD